MEICHLSVEILRANPENIFNPLTSQEYEDLMDSIATYGVQVPLIVTPEEGGYYTVISGNNRLRAAKELGMKTLPCHILEIEMFEGAMDTEIFRRHLSPEERSQYKVLKEEKSREILEREIERKLHGGLYELYKKGKIELDFAVKLMKLDMKEQTVLLKSFTHSPVVVEKVVEKIIEKEAEDEEPEYGLGEDEKDEEISRLKEEIENLNRKLDKKDKELRELKKWKSENQEAIEEKLEELNNEKARARESVQGEIKEAVKNLLKTNDKLTEQIRAKEREVESLKEEIEKFQRSFADKEIEAKANAVLLAEEEKKHMVNVVIFYLDEIIEGIRKIQEQLNNPLSKRMEKLALEKIGYIHEEMRKLANRVSKGNFVQNPKEMRN